nr:MAG TPA: hypothetical protein [Bacteriophage sp.]
MLMAINISIIRLFYILILMVMRLSMVGMVLH